MRMCMLAASSARVQASGSLSQTGRITLATRIAASAARAVTGASHIRLTRRSVESMYIVYVFRSVCIWINFERRDRKKTRLSCLSTVSLQTPQRAHSVSGPLSARPDDTSHDSRHTSTLGSGCRARPRRSSVVEVRDTDSRHRVRRRCAVTVLCGSVASFLAFSHEAQSAFSFLHRQITKLLFNFMNMRMSASRLYLLFVV